jgi:hypothetical protein
VILQATRPLHLTDFLPHSRPTRTNVGTPYSVVFENWPPGYCSECNSSHSLPDHPQTFKRRPPLASRLHPHHFHEVRSTRLATTAVRQSAGPFVCTPRYNQRANNPPPSSSPHGEISQLEHFTQHRLDTDHHHHHKIQSLHHTRVRRHSDPTTPVRILPMVPVLSHRTTSTR